MTLIRLFLRYAWMPIVVALVLYKAYTDPSHLFTFDCLVGVALLTIAHPILLSEMDKPEDTDY